MDIDANDTIVRKSGSVLLDGVSLTVRPGELLGLIGPNGAGKSTLLRVLANLQPVDSGTVVYDGQTAKETGRRALARRIAYLPQQGEVHWPMPVERVVALGRLAHAGLGGMSEVDHHAVERALDRADLLALRTRSIGTLSGGERMRVLLARALATEAECLLADEPVTALDPLHQLQAMSLFAEAARSGAGVVVVLHDLTLAARFCDRLILLSKGRILGEGDPASVLTEDHIAAAFKVTLLRGEHEGRDYFVPWAMLGKDVDPLAPPEA